MLGARADDAAGDGGGAEPEGLGHRFRGGPGVATAQACEDLAAEARIRRPGRLELLVALPRELLLAPLSIPDALHRDRHLLVGEEDRAGLVPPADEPGLAARPAGLPAGELAALGLHHLAAGLEAQGDQRLDPRDHGGEIRECGGLSLSGHFAAFTLPWAVLRTTLGLTRLLSLAGSRFAPQTARQYGSRFAISTDYGTGPGWAGTNQRARGRRRGHTRSGSQREGPWAPPSVMQGA